MNAEKWQDRYYVTLKGEEYRGYKDVSFSLFRVDMPEVLIANLLKPFDIDPKSEENIYIASYVEQTFSLKYVTKLIEYFGKWEEMKIVITLADKPATNLMGVGAIPVGGLQDFYMFSSMEGYPLNFKVWGYYDLRQCKEIETAPMFDSKIGEMIADADQTISDLENTNPADISEGIPFSF
jgi:hypothetical protein